MRTTIGSSHLQHDVSHQQHVLLVEDDPVTRRTVTRYFAAHGVATSTAATGAEMNRCLTAREPSLIILNRQVGRENGLDLLRSIRTSSDVPVIIASSDRLEEIDCVLGLELGADDYIVKPFRLRELLARMRAILRRQRFGRLSKAREPAPAGYVFDGWHLECHTRRLTTPDGQSQSLTNSEYTLLVAFLEASQRLLTREQLLQATRVHEDIFDRSIDVQVLRLRRKLEGHAGGSRMILTERGVGYSFAPPVESLGHRVVDAYRPQTVTACITASSKSGRPTPDCRE